MAKTYVSAVPLTMVRTADGAYRNVFEGEPITGESVAPDDLKRLVRKGFLVEKPAELESAPERSATVDDILAEVGEDRDKAAAALEVEKAGKNRSTLVSKLEAIVSAEI